MSDTKPERGATVDDKEESRETRVSFPSKMQIPKYHGKCVIGSSESTMITIYPPEESIGEQLLVNNNGEISSRALLSRGSETRAM